MVKVEEYLKLDMEFRDKKILDTLEQRAKLELLKSVKIC